MTAKLFKVMQIFFGTPLRPSTHLHIHRRKQNKPAEDSFDAPFGTLQFVRPHRVVVDGGRPTFLSVFLLSRVNINLVCHDSAGKFRLTPQITLFVLLKIQQISPNINQNLPPSGGVNDREWGLWKLIYVPRVDDNEPCIIHGQ